MPFFSKIKAIIFDLDDTLYPQIEYKRSGFKEVALRIEEKLAIDPNIVLHHLEKILKEFGASYPHMFDRLAERVGINPDIVLELVQVFIEHDPQIKCFDGVMPLLERLKREYRLGILTDGRSSVQQKKVKALGLNRMVDHLLYSDELGLVKPAIELFQWFERELALNGEQLVYVGDNPKKDFWGANRRKWTTIHVMTGDAQKANMSKEYQSTFSIASVIDIEMAFLQQQ